MTPNSSWGVREPGTVRWVRRGGHYALERTLRRDPFSLAASRPGVPRPACPLRTILLANGVLFAFGILGWLAYLLR